MSRFSPSSLLLAAALAVPIAMLLACPWLDRLPSLLWLAPVSALAASLFEVRGPPLVSNCVSKSNIFSFAAGELLPWSIRRVPLSDSNW
jgi:hypothetical protein